MVYLRQENGVDEDLEIDTDVSTNSEKPAETDAVRKGIARKIKISARPWVMTDHFAGNGSGH